MLANRLPGQAVGISRKGQGPGCRMILYILRLYPLFGRNTHADLA